MAAPDLDLTPSEYSDLGTELGAIGREFSRANARSDDIADAVGHSKLADTLRDFAHSWDDTRAKMTGDIDSLSKYASAVGEGFSGTDGGLADSLTADPKTE